MRKKVTVNLNLVVSAEQCPNGVVDGTSIITKEPCYILETVISTLVVKTTVGQAPLQGIKVSGTETYAVVWSTSSPRPDTLSARD